MKNPVGQVFTNVEFIVKNEIELPGWRKRWILNRIINQTEYASDEGKKKRKDGEQRVA